MPFKKQQGYLYKLGNTDRYFSMSKFYKRYFILDNEVGTLSIKHDDHPSAKAKQVIPFRDIVKVVNEEYCEEIDAECKWGKWQQVFSLVTKLRRYRLYAESRHDK